MKQDIAMRAAIIAVIVGTSATVPTVQAQDIQHGRRLALEVCATCHAVLANQTRSPVADVPSFEAVAVTPGMTAMALNVWLTAQSHPTMPNIILSQTDVEDVSAYILSLAE
ncbi:c-type cytochrome [Rhizobium laguerreae]|uniref:c-type cytochrome n=2 Tax=Rhizobium TaxID=379 RepID=UPI001FE73497|nr:c-type cytochrome [Rhizobium laguerreae]